MLKPEGAVECWFVCADELERSFGAGKSFTPSHPFPYAYFQRVNKRDDDTIEGYLGHERLNGSFHAQITSGYEYFNEYNKGICVCITFDKVIFYRVTEIYPTRPLLFTLKKIKSAYGDTSPANTSKISRPLHFEDLGWEEFERLAFAYASHMEVWNSIQWLGQTGGDGGRDIWGVKGYTTYCYQCAKYKSLPFKKVTDDIDKLVKENIIPDNFIVVCGGRVSANMRTAIHSYAAQYGINNVDVWSGAELEEKLRKDTPELIDRFF